MEERRGRIDRSHLRREHSGTAFVQLHGGLLNAIDQAVTYGIRERDRTRIASAPRIHPVQRLFAVLLPKTSSSCDGRPR
jgi:hypothetical protein